MAYDTMGPTPCTCREPIRKLEGPKPTTINNNSPRGGVERDAFGEWGGDVTSMGGATGAAQTNGGEPGTRGTASQSAWAPKPPGRARRCTVTCLRVGTNRKDVPKRWWTSSMTCTGAPDLKLAGGPQGPLNQWARWGGATVAAAAAAGSVARGPRCGSGSPDRGGATARKNWGSELGRASALAGDSAWSLRVLTSAL